MRRVTTTLALALFLLGCAPKLEPVALRTGVNGCFLTMFPIWGRLLPDPVYGVTLDGVPIIWPTGFTGERLAGGGVQVLDSEGEVVATTGKDYWLGNGPSSSNELAFAACSVADADPERLKGGGIAMPAQRASDWLQGQKETLVLMNIRFVWCDDAPHPEWCEWVRRDHGGPVVAKIEEGTLTVGVRSRTPVGLAEELCRDVAADDDVLPGVYSHVDVEAGSDRIVADCFVP